MSEERMSEEPTSEDFQASEDPDRRISTTGLIGCTVEASDGPIGQVDPASEEVAPDHLVIDTGGALLSKKVLLPVWVIAHVDEVSRTVHVPRTRDRVKDAPRFDRDLRVTDPSYRAHIDEHYIDEPGG